MATPWRVYGNDTVAARLNRAELPGFFRKTITVGPHEAAVVIQDGKPQEPITEERAKVAGLFDRFARLLGRGADLEVVFVDLAPVDLPLFLGETTTEHTATAATSQAAASRGGERPAVDLVQAARRTGWTAEVATGESTRSAETRRTDVSQVCLQAVSLDREIIPAECVARVCVDLGEVEPFVGLMRGKAALATWDLAALLRDELLAKVLLPQIAAHRSDELRGNRQLLADIEQDVRSQLQGTFATCGLSLDSFAIHWGLTEQELADIQRRREEREEEALQFTHRRRLAEMQRELEIQQTRVANLQQIKKAQAEGDDELKTLALAAEINRDLMAKGEELDLARVDAQIQAVQLDAEQRQAQARLEQQREEQLLALDMDERRRRLDLALQVEQTKAEDEEMKSLLELKLRKDAHKHELEMAQRRQEIDAEFRRQQQALEAQFQQRQAKLQETLARMGMIERLVSQGFGTGATDSAVLREMLQQATAQEYATTSDAKVQARSQADAAKADLETYQQAEDRERGHQQQMADLSAGMMEAAKPGAGPGARGPASAGALTCPHCNAPVQRGWKACPQCGGRLAAKCPSCNADLEPHWKACPHCGEALA